jgi:hydrogenase maturation protease
MVLIIGYGNTLRRDDGVGHHLAKIIQERCGAASVRVVEAHQLVPELIDEMVFPDVTAVLFMDARVTTDICSCQGIPEEVEIREIEAAVSSPSFGHHLDPSTLLAYARHLNGGHPRAWLISIPGVDFEYGEGFSEYARRSLTIAEDKVIRMLHSIFIK